MFEKEKIIFTATKVFFFFFVKTPVSTFTVTVECKNNKPPKRRDRFRLQLSNRGDYRCRLKIPPGIRGEGMAFYFVAVFDSRVKRAGFVIIFPVHFVFTVLTRLLEPVRRRACPDRYSDVGRTTAGFRRTVLSIFSFSYRSLSRKT